MRVTSKGQVTIPQAIRDKYGFLPETDVAFVEEGERVYLVKQPATTTPGRGSDYSRSCGGVLPSA